MVVFYNFDKIQAIKIAAKLKEKHIELPPFTAVNFITHILSLPVAAGISTLATLKRLPDSAMYVAQIVEHLIACSALSIAGH